MNTAAPPSALLVLDVFSTFDFPGGDALLAQTSGITDNVRRLCGRYRDAGRPVVFVNDNFGRWEESFGDLVTRVGDSKGSSIATTLRPEPSDYRLLKPRHSAFFETSLPSLLAHLDVARIVVAGIAADSCVLSTVMDAHVRGFDSVVPKDTTASQSAERTARVLAHLSESCGIDTPVSDEVVL
jgi:nicotinamidase-related amidase